MDFLATLKTLIAWILQFSATCLVVWLYPYWSMVLTYEALERVHVKFWKMAFGLPLKLMQQQWQCLVSWGNSPSCKELEEGEVFGKAGWNRGVTGRGLHQGVYTTALERHKSWVKKVWREVEEIGLEKPCTRGRNCWEVAWWVCGVEYLRPT